MNTPATNDPAPRPTRLPRGRALRRLLAFVALTASLAGCARAPRQLLDVTLDAGSEIRWVAHDSLLAVALLGRGVALLDAADGGTVAAFRMPSLPSKWAHGLAVSATGETLAVATEDSVRVFTTRALTPLLAAPGGGEALALSGDGTHLAWSDGTVGRVLEVASGRVLKESRMFAGRLGVAWAARKDAFAWTDVREVLFLRGDTSFAGELGPFMDARPTQLLFSESGRTLAVAESTEFVSFWDVGSQKARWRLKLAGPARFERLALSADNWYLATARDGRVRVLWAYTGRKVAEWTPHRGAAVRDLAFSRDSRRLATVGADGHVRVWAIPAPKAGRR